MRMKVVIPSHVGPGQTFQVRAHGKLFNATVPAGLHGGSEMFINVPDPAPAPAAQQGQRMNVTLPPGAFPGGKIKVNAAGRMLDVTVPQGAFPGQVIQIIVPPAQTKMQSSPQDFFAPRPPPPSSMSSNPSSLPRSHTNHIAMSKVAPRSSGMSYSPGKTSYSVRQSAWANTSTWGFCCCWWVCTKENSVGIKSKFGKFSGTTQPGCEPYQPCCCEKIEGSMSCRLAQIDVPCETKTKDNVIVNVVVSVMYRVDTAKIKMAYYGLNDVVEQMTSYVFDTIRSSVPKLELDALFLAQDDLAHDIRELVSAKMQEYGYIIVQTLVTDISPDARVRSSINAISASRYIRKATQFRADANKILEVKAAEADAERKHLNGMGLARQRGAILSSLADTITSFKDSVRGTTNTDVMDLLMTNQYFDLMGEMGQRDVASTVMTR